MINPANGSVDLSGESAALAEGEFSPDRIQEMVSSNFCELEMSMAPGDRPVRTRLELVHLGQIDVLRYRSEGMQRGTRRWAHIRNDNADYVSLYMPTEGDFYLECGDRATTVSPGQFCFIATNRPFALAQHFRNQETYYRSTYVKIPGPLIRQRVLSVDELAGQSFPILPGAGALMRQVVEAALEQGASLSESAAAKFGETVLNVIGIAAEWAAEINGCRQPAQSLSRQRIVDRAKRFIEENLSDPDLNNVTIARHCNVSERYLYAAFADTELTIAGYVRDRRLLLCHAALCDPLLDDRSISWIAGEWGMTDPSQFSRLYRSRFKCTPREQRMATRQSRMA